jgi:hypothetical protein
LLVEEAGGVITAFEGSSAFPISLHDDFSQTNFPTLAAATADVFKMGKNKIQRKSKFAVIVQNKASTED